MKILIISEYITPVQAIASIRWTKIGKYLSKLGHSVSVLTNEKNFAETLRSTVAYRYDDSIAGDLQYFDSYFEIKPGITLKYLIFARSLYSKMKDAFLKNRSASQKDATSDLANSDFRWKFLYKINDLWARQAYRQYKKIVKDYDVIISSYGPLWATMIAQKFKQNNPELIWLSDFRDPVHSPSSFANNEAKLFAREKNSKADAILGVSKGCLNNLYLPENFNHKTHCVTNGFDPEEFCNSSAINKSNKFELVYTGTLYKAGIERKQDFTPILKALASLISAGQVSAQDIVICYAGSSRCDFESALIDYPDIPYEANDNVPRSQVKDMQNSAALLICLTCNYCDWQDVIPAKLFEYLHSERPIVGVVDGELLGAMVKEIIEKSNMGFCYESANKQTDFLTLKSFILSKYNEWKQEGVASCVPNKDYIFQFEHGQLALRIIDIIENVYIERSNKV